MLLAKKEWYRASKLYRAEMRKIVNDLKKTGLSQNQIAKKIGMSESNLRGILNPEKRNRNK